jgi:hypothetical protein
MSKYDGMDVDDLKKIAKSWGVSHVNNFKSAKKLIAAIDKAERAHETREAAMPPGKDDAVQRMKDKAAREATLRAAQPPPPGQAGRPDPADFSNLPPVQEAPDMPVSAEPVRSSLYAHVGEHVRRGMRTGVIMDVENHQFLIQYEDNKRGQLEAATPMEVCLLSQGVQPTGAAPPSPQRFELKNDVKLVIRGMVHGLKAGRIITEGTYDLKAIRDAGAVLHPL